MQNSSNLVKIIKLSQINSEECLSLIGATQISSILETLSTDKPAEPDVKDTVSVATNKFKKIAPALKETTFTILEPKFEDRTDSLIYISCILCPFFCLNESKIKEHFELVHKTRKPKELFEIKCPVCPNIFFHKLSFRGHLTYDHCLTNEEDIEKITQLALYMKVPSNFNDKITPDLIEKNTASIEMNLNEEVKEIETLNCKIENDKSLIIVQGGSDVNDNFVELESVIEPIIATKVSNKKSNDTITKFLDDRNYHRCLISNCKVRLLDQEKLHYHTTCHHNAAFKCPECSTDFKLWNKLAGHLWRIHKIDIELYRCDKCDYRTYSLGKLNSTHKLIHSEIKRYVCNICNKSFKNNKQMKNHQATHKKPSEYTYSCEECKKTFGAKHLLKIHIDRIHKKIRPYLCSYCGYKGGTRGALKMHIRQHTGEKPFACDQCNYSSSDHNSLRRHKLLHTGEKPYKCSQCDYQCIQSSTYKAHISMKHPGLDKKLLFSCPMCQFLSISKDIYDMHVASQHPDMKA